MSWEYHTITIDVTEECQSPTLRIPPATLLVQKLENITAAYRGKGWNPVNIAFECEQATVTFRRQDMQMGVQ